MQAEERGLVEKRREATRKHAPKRKVFEKRKHLPAGVDEDAGGRNMRAVAQEGTGGEAAEARASSISGDEPSGCSRARCVKVVAFQKLI